MVDNEWIDRYVVELAEWGARLDERGLRQTSDGDTHHLAWMRIMQDGREADAELVTANREEARASVATFPGRPKEINGRVYLHIDDYRSWPERRVQGDIPLAGPDGEGVVEASWNAWIDANGRAPTPEESRWAGRRQDGKVAELSGVPVDSLWSYIRRSDFLIMDDPNELARWQKARQDTVDSLNQWTQSEGIDEGERRRWPDDVTSVRTRIADWKASAWGYIADVFVTEAVADAISNRYFDGHPVLFAKEAEDLKDTIAVMENMVQLYNETVARLSEPDYCIDLDEVRRTAEPMIRKAIRYAVEAAKGDALRNFGEDDAANEILLSHLLEGSEKENS